MHSQFKMYKNEEEYRRPKIIITSNGERKIISAYTNRAIKMYPGETLEKLSQRLKRNFQTARRNRKTQKLELSRLKVELQSLSQEFSELQFTIRNLQFSHAFQKKNYQEICKVFRFFITFLQNLENILNKEVQRHEYLRGLINNHKQGVVKVENVVKIINNN